MASYQYIYVMKELTKVYPGGKKTLENIWLSFLPGAKIGVLGLNGSGKSSLLRIMAGVDTEILGEARPQPGIKIGYLPQEPELDANKTVREEVEAVLMRVGGDLRYGVVGFYTEARSVVMDARDPELVRNVFDGLPVQYVMKPGSTDLGAAINAAVKVVAPLPEKTVRLVIFTDGDTVPLQPILPRPKSVKDVLVLGVGDPRKGTFIAGHQSRQDAEVLANVARALRGTYHDVNEKHLPTDALGDLVRRMPPAKSGLSLAQLAVLAMLLGVLRAAGVPVLLVT